jgi:trigger factor
MTDQDLALETPETETPEAELTEEQQLLAELKEAIQVKRETIGSLRLKLTVDVPRDTVDHRMGKQFAELKRDSIIPGFRKGHAPLRLVEERVGADVGDQLKSQLLSNGYLAAVEKENLKPLGDPLFWIKTKEERVGEDKKPRTVEVEKLVPFDQALDHVVLPKEGSMSFSCELELKPEFELPGLDNIPIERPAVSIDDEDVDLELRRLLMRRGTFQPVEGGKVQADDMLYVRMKMSVGDEVIHTEDNFDIAARDIRVKGVPLVGLSKALVGKKCDDEVTFEATVPDDHEKIDLRGKTAKFEFVIREIKRLELPPMDAEFLTSIGFESEDELRTAVRTTLESELDRTIKAKMYDQVGEYLLKNTTLDIPEGLSARQTDRAVSRRMIEMLQMGIPPAELEKGLDELRGKAHASAVRDLRLYFIIEKIADEREVEVKEEEINAAIAQIARRTGKRFDRVRDELSKGDGLHTLYWQLRDEKVMDEILTKAKITEVEGPKKKAGSKSEPPASARAESKPAPTKQPHKGEHEHMHKPDAKSQARATVKESKEKPKPEKKHATKSEGKGGKGPSTRSAGKPASRTPQKRGKSG